MNKITIHQILPTITINDAISSEALNIYNLLNNEPRFKVKLFAENIHPLLRFKTNKIKNIKSGNSSILLYHFSIGDYNLDNIISKYNKRIMIFHNITPPEFFKDSNPVLYNLLKLGIHQLKTYKDKFNLVLSDSLYNKDFLIQLGYNSKNILELPIVKIIKKYKPVSRLIKKYHSKSVKNFLFVGRIAPNKKIEDVIKSFYYYKKLLNENANLFLVGKYSIKNKYYLQLKYLLKLLNLDNVIFFKDIKDNELYTLYSISDAFICMSEHEGFCVPLIESMYFKLPIIAFNSTAVPFTLKYSGILLKEKNYALISEIMHAVTTNLNLREKIIKKQTEIFNRYYSTEKTINILKNSILKMNKG